MSLQELNVSKDETSLRYTTSFTTLAPGALLIRPVSGVHGVLSTSLSTSSYLCFLIPPLLPISRLSDGQPGSFGQGIAFSFGLDVAALS